MTKLRLEILHLQTRVSKRAPQEFRNWRVQGDLPTLPNPLPTLRQPFANLSPTFCQPFLPTPLQAPPSVDPRHLFRDTAWVNGFFHTNLILCISCRASEAKRQKHQSAQKVGFPPIPKRVPKSAEKCGEPHFLRIFCAFFLRKKRGSPHLSALFGTLSGIGGNPTFCAD